MAAGRVSDGEWATWGRSYLYMCRMVKVLVQPWNSQWINWSIGGVVDSVGGKRSGQVERFEWVRYNASEGSGTLKCSRS